MVGFGDEWDYWRFGGTCEDSDIGTYHRGLNQRLVVIIGWVDLEERCLYIWPKQVRPQSLT